MPEYYGYVKRETPGTDWSGLIGDLGEKVQSAIDRPKRDRAARLSILEKNEAILNEYELGSDPTMNKVVTGGVDALRTQMYDWKKQADAGNMSRAEYNSKFNTAMSGYKAFSKANKSYVAQIEGSSARQQPDKNGFVPASPKEIYMNNYNAGLADLSNTSMVTNPQSGKVYLVKKDEQGNILSQRESQSLLQYGNLTSENFDLNGFLDVQTKGIKTWTIETPGKRGGSTTVESASLNEENYIKVKNATIRGATNDINNAATILVNYGEGYDFYVESKDNTELNSILDETVENERLDAEEAGLDFDADKVRQDKFEKMIKLSPDGTGVMQPNMTDKQKQGSKDIVAAGFEMRMGRKETSIAERAAKTSGGDENVSDYGAVQSDTYNAINRAWDNKSGSEMASLMKPGHTVKVEKFKDKNGKWQVKFNVYKQVSGTATTEAARDFVFSARDPEQLATYIYNSKAGYEAIQDYKEGERISKGNKKSKAY
tara:strand:- start:397 stop:1854 length:1458 start_codon:yes stop_codon:yes gene_type:complete